MSPQNAAGFTEQIQPGAFTQSLPNAPEWVKRLLGQHDPLAAALELIGRRSDVVAVQLPEPTRSGNVSTSWGWVTQWHPTHQVNSETRLITVDDPGRCLNVTQARDLAAALLAAAARAEAADGAR